MSKELNWDLIFDITEEQINRSSPAMDWYLDSIDGARGKSFKLFRNNWIEVQFEISDFSKLVITLSPSANIDAISKGARFSDGQCIIKGAWEHNFWDLSADAELSFLDINLLDISDYSLYPGMNCDLKNDERYSSNVFGVRFYDQVVDLENETLTQDWKPKDELNFDAIQKWSFSRGVVLKSLPPTDWIKKVTIYRRSSYPMVIPDGMEEIHSTDQISELLMEFTTN